MRPRSVRRCARWLVSKPSRARLGQRSRSLRCPALPASGLTARLDLDIKRKTNIRSFYEPGMNPDRPSRTAQHNALFRAIEQRLPRPLFADPWAQRFLRGRYRLAGLLPAAALARAIDARWPGPRAAVCVRTRWIDDAICAAIA